MIPEARRKDNHHFAEPGAGEGRLHGHETETAAALARHRALPVRLLRRSRDLPPGGKRIDAWTRGAFFADANQGSWLAFLAAMAVSGAFFQIRCRVAPKPDARR